VNGSEASADCEGGNMAQSIADEAIGDGLTGFAVALEHRGARQEDVGDDTSKGCQHTRIARFLGSSKYSGPPA
jgi:hypothetical protein